MGAGNSTVAEPDTKSIADPVTRHVTRPIAAAKARDDAERKVRGKAIVTSLTAIERMNNSDKLNSLRYSLDILRNKHTFHEYLRNANLASKQQIAAIAEFDLDIKRCEAEIARLDNLLKI